MKRMLLSLLGLTAPLLLCAGEPGKAPSDKRLGPPKTLNDYFPFTPPASKEAWEKRRQEVREQVLVANGLWPMPEKIPLKPVIHGKIERDGYTIEKVFFASYPGHYVCGNLYRPTFKTNGKRPAVLCPHGHWANGRFYEAKDWEAQIKQGAEQTKESAMYPLQARCAQLARMGCVVFFYDMVGYADSQQIVHRAGFTDPEAELRLQNALGLQTFNSIRALDFLVSLPEVDPLSVGVTGASGGGTQTFILCGIDDRPAVAFPAVMVSTAMQGGCVCENASYLRVGTGNIELAGLFAPKPLGMSGADDWTIDIETKGLPELKALYKILGAEDRVMAKTYKQFKHNYNQVSRELMYNFFNKHLTRNQTEPPVKEQPFVPVATKDLSVFDKEHPLPADAVNTTALRRYLTMQADKQLEELLPTDERRLGGYRRVLGTALRVMMGSHLPARGDLEIRDEAKSPGGEAVNFGEWVLSRKGQGEAVKVTLLGGKDHDGTVVVWVHPRGSASVKENGKLVPAAQKIIDSKAQILAVDVLRLQDEKKGPAINKQFAGYSFGYNRPLVSNRVHDILTAVAFARGVSDVKKIHLVGFENAGPWVALARGLCGDSVQRTAADMDQFRFERIGSVNDEMMLPGALKYGGLLTLAGLAAPHELYLHNLDGTGSARWLEAAYQSSGGAKNLERQEKKSDAEAVVSWLLR